MDRGTFIEKIEDATFALAIGIGGGIFALVSRTIPDNLSMSGKIISLTLTAGMGILYYSIAEAWVYGYKNEELADRGYLIVTFLVAGVILFVVQKARRVKLVS